MSYRPDPGALPNTTAFVHLLSSRDLSLQVPVNFVNLPGISLTPACFASRYEEYTAAKCISNLLAIGFRRFEIDIYWDVSRRLWSLCPVQLGTAGTAPTDTTIIEPQSSRTSATSLGTAHLSVRADRHRATPLGRSGILHRAQTSSVVLPTPTKSSTSGTTLLSASTTVSAVSATSTGTALASGTLVEAGPYSCTAGTTFNLFLDVLNAYLDSTENNLNATTRYLILNLHAAAEASDPTSGGSQPDIVDLPRDGNLLSNLISVNSSGYLYTPQDLSTQRADLNSSTSWFGVASQYRPDAAYFTVGEIGGHQATPNGWPSESYMELIRGERLVVSYGTIDPQMEGYNFSADAQEIFSSEFIQVLQNDVTVTTAGVTTGCFYQPGDFDIGKVNSSWATYHFNTTLVSSFLDTGTMNLSACGISPSLNATLNNMTAAEDFNPYREFAESALWTWDTGQPPVSNTSDENCAALNATTGRWRGVACGQQHYGACRIGNRPYEWSITDDKSQYYNINFACRDGTSFATPRTALENTYLAATWRSYLANQSDPDDLLLWVDFNDLDLNTCWVIGQNATCPYLSESGSSNRKIVVPTVAAVIVFVLAALTIFVKCAANRQNTKRKRRRRGEEGWDYEGVPS